MNVLVWYRTFASRSFNQRDVPEEGCWWERGICLWVLNLIKIKPVRSLFRKRPHVNFLRNFRNLFLKSNRVSVSNINIFRLLAPLRTHPGRRQLRQNKPNRPFSIGYLKYELFLGFCFRVFFQ